MVENRSTGFYGVGGAMNFKSGDISGTAAGTQDDKMGPGTEYGAIPQKEEEEENDDSSEFVDRSAQLSASLTSLAAMNAAQVIKDNESIFRQGSGKSRAEKHDQDEMPKPKTVTSPINSISTEEDKFIDT